MEPTIPDVFVASEDLMNNRPNQLRGTLSAIYRALAHMRQDRQFGLQFLKEFTKIDDAKLNESVYEESTMQQSSDGKIERKWVADSLQIASGTWKMPELAQVNPDNIFTNAFSPGMPHQ
jgi:NitT/TauT family transport system substrate-binding protein